jgi:hypothetical protein
VKQSLANVRSQVRWTARRLALNQQGQDVRLNNYRFFRFCLGRHPHNSHPKIGQIISATFLAKQLRASIAGSGLDNSDAN